MSAKSEENNRRNGRNAKTLRTSSGSFELLTPRDREGSFEPQIVKKGKQALHPELEAKVLKYIRQWHGLQRHSFTRGGNI